MGVLTVMAVMVGSLASQSLAAGDAPLQPSQAVVTSQAGPRLVIRAQLHPEVAASRALATQPTHPHLVRIERAGAVNYLDPYVKLDGDHGMDTDHSLVKAQRLARSLRGICDADLAAMRNATEAATAHLRSTGPGTYLMHKADLLTDQPGPRFYTAPITAGAAATTQPGTRYQPAADPMPRVFIPVHPAPAPRDRQLLVNNDD
jgi:hypothetical protein